jgi:hypothetical protein
LGEKGPSLHILEENTKDSLRSFIDEFKPIPSHEEPQSKDAEPAVALSS